VLFCRRKSLVMETTETADRSESGKDGEGRLQQREGGGLKYLRGLDSGKPARGRKRLNSLFELVRWDQKQRKPGSHKERIPQKEEKRISDTYSVHPNDASPWWRRKRARNTNCDSIL